LLKHIKSIRKPKGGMKSAKENCVDAFNDAISNIDEVIASQGTML